MVDYCISLFKKEQEEKNLREFGIKTISYIAQGLHFISHNTAYIPAQFGEDSKVLLPYDEFLEKKEDNRTADDKIDAIIGLCGLGG